jgi:hypothetical protein
VPLTDVIGTLQSWTAGAVTVVDANGEVTTVPEADLVAAKVVPPRPDRRRPAADPPDSDDEVGAPAGPATGVPPDERRPSEQSANGDVEEVRR